MIFSKSHILNASMFSFFSYCGEKFYRKHIEFNMLSKFLIYCDCERENRDSAEFIDLSRDVSSIVAVANRVLIIAQRAFVGDLIRPGSYRWFFRSFARQTKPIRFDLIWILRL